MSVHITFDIFSGVPNPAVVLDDTAAATFLNGLGFDSTKATQLEQSAESKLGYRGLIVEQRGMPKNGLDSRFRIANKQVNSAGKSYALTTQSPESTLLGNSALVHAAGISSELAALIQNEAVTASAIGKKNAPVPSESGTPPTLLKCACAPVYEPSWWNDAATGGARQFHNNCYNYACDYRTDTYAQPGRAGGMHLSSILCAAVRPAVVSDALAGYAPTPSTNLKCPDKGNLIAIAIWPNWDFHCYRLGSDGYWTHKPGSNPVTNLDNSGRVIVDPRTADRGRYTDFCSFMVVMHGHVKLQ